MIIHDQFNKEIRLNFKQPQDKPNGEHVLAIAFFNDGYLLTRHKIRGIEFPGGKTESGESSETAVIREVFEETGGMVSDMTYVAQYTVFHPNGTHWFSKDVFAVQIEALKMKEDYLETAGPVTCKHLDDISNSDKSFLLEDEAILKCVERVIELGLYQKKADAD
ncbi:RNA deprotection pyrophosphohydrolase [Staphylococcus simulans]